MFFPNNKLFIHIPKTGGSSLEYAISSKYYSEQIEIDESEERLTSRKTDRASADSAEPTASLVSLAATVTATSALLIAYRRASPIPHINRPPESLTGGGGSELLFFTDALDFNLCASDRVFAISSSAMAASAHDNP